MNFLQITDAMLPAHSFTMAGLNPIGVCITPSNLTVTFDRDLESASGNNGVCVVFIASTDTGPQCPEFYRPSDWNYGPVAGNNSVWGSAVPSTVGDHFYWQFSKPTTLQNTTGLPNAYIEDITVADSRLVLALDPDIEYPANLRTITAKVTIDGSGGVLFELRDAEGVLVFSDPSQSKSFANQVDVGGGFMVQIYLDLQAAPNSCVYEGRFTATRYTCDGFVVNIYLQNAGNPEWVRFYVGKNGAVVDDYDGKLVSNSLGIAPTDATIPVQAPPPGITMLVAGGRILRNNSTGRCMVSGVVPDVQPPAMLNNTFVRIVYAPVENPTNLALAINVTDNALASQLSGDPDASNAANWEFDTYDPDNITKLSSPGEYPVTGANFSEGGYIAVSAMVDSPAWGRRFKASYKGTPILGGRLFTVSYSTADVQSSLPTTVLCNVQPYPQLPGDTPIVPTSIEWHRIAEGWGTTSNLGGGALGNGIESIIPDDGSGHRVIGAYVNSMPGLISEVYGIVMVDSANNPESNPEIVHYSVFTAMPI